jgi:hypothetical protein
MAQHKWLDGITPADVRGRADTDHLLPVDRERALRVARAIRHPWYRCQALSSVARAYESGPFALRLLEESLEAAYEQTEPNRIVTVASWPLGQLAKLDPMAAAAVVERLLAIIAEEPHGLRRLDGLARLIIAVASVSTLRELVQPVFVQTVTQSQGWRTERTVACVASFIASVDSAFARSLLASRIPNRFALRAAKEIQLAHGHSGP